MLNTTLKVTEKQKVNFTPDQPLDGPIVLSSDNPAAAEFRYPAVPGDKHTIWPVAMGSAVLTAAALSAGQPVSETYNVTVTAVAATTLGSTLDPPEPK